MSLRFSYTFSFLSRVLSPLFLMAPPLLPLEGSLLPLLSDPSVEKDSWIFLAQQR